ncbi:MAG: GIY-YIG nuclease family protein [Candidatus Woesearchaeota archaeon]|jgi:predicted GIY-YIG superfamily endonuclease|nr:GIY-YIG nuclease family protein [Candidatus Woesearchaeota archaeon]
MKKSAVYKLTSPSGKVYIGQSVDVAQRFSKHKRQTSKTKTKLGSAIRKYG